ncbi:fungal-specific transcription factor domain-containing protein [Fusarium oxysporum]|nr:fungal-specific transcription factor domain-containing protein [Fusarium oxysporum]
MDINHRLASPCLRKTQAKRTTRACDDCRRLKEKCIGTVPCDRCKRFGRSCEFSNRFKRSRVIPAASIPEKESRVISPGDAPGYFEVERIQALEDIVRYFTGLEQCSREDLESIVVNISLDKGALPRKIVGEENDGMCNDGQDHVNTDTMSSASSVYEGFSHCDFSRRVQQKVKDQLNDSDEVLSLDTPVSGRASSAQLLSRDAFVLEAVSLFPPVHAALILLRVFFKFAQTNYFYIDEETLRQRLEQFYSYPTRVGIDDTAWVCVSLMVFALGTQFLHLYRSSARNCCKELINDAYNICQTMDNTLALTFYRKASTLIPDILAINSIETIQAFLLFGIYVLPIDPAGLSCTYLGIAIKAATQFNMHQRSDRDLSPREIELRKRVWWTAYTLERRVCILHGRPVSVSRLEIDANPPIDLEELQPKEQVNTFQNNMAMLRLTIFIEDARDGIFALKNSHNTPRVKEFQKIIQMKEKLHNYWQSLSQETCCRDLTPGKPLFRSNVHLTLTYYLVHILIGRPFIFDESNIEVEKSLGTDWLRLRKEAVDDCLKSAVATIDLCQLLHDESTLSTSSYTEFSSCYAAVLALVAQGVSDKNNKLKDASKRGMELLREMAIGVFSTTGEKRAMEGLEGAFDKLNHQAHKEEGGVKLDEDGYLQFRNWVATQQVVPEALQLPRQENQMINVLGGSFIGSQYSGTAGGKVGSALPGYAELSSLPELGAWLDHGFEQPMV